MGKPHLRRRRVVCRDMWQAAALSCGSPVTQCLVPPLEGHSEDRRNRSARPEAGNLPSGDGSPWGCACSPGLFLQEVSLFIPCFTISPGTDLPEPWPEPFWDSGPLGSPEMAQEPGRRRPL